MGGSRLSPTGQRYRFSDGDDPKVFEAKIQVHVIFTWVLSLVAGDVTAVLEAKMLKEMDFAWVQGCRTRTAPLWFRSTKQTKSFGYTLLT